MFKRMVSVLLCSAALQLHAAPATPPVHHYVFFILERAGIQKPWFARSKVFEGAQLKYTWRSLEPRPGEYDFAAIDQDLATLSAQGKRLFLQIQDVSFSEDIVNVPEYLRTDPAFHGGVDRQYEFANDKDAKPKLGGWVARRWDSAVAERFAKLLAALGAGYDGRVEGITLPDILDFAQQTLGASYIFWYPEEPYFTREVLPALQGQGATAVSR
ncbi:hypothetical protein [Rhodoferax aquaticus]|uniref:Uncharacterized protein n=1 Tax=Rhodoferax aquaticus TaxID=2527691 RepID=A0A515ELZ9_9BURK|nr:hypothetical protein [Rhodoferax aquaticus]QDL53687.1 hypothetical protein EXZ61_05600 [Rhodoferax aquaticus]